MDRMPHEFDDDAVCIHCGFDGAEAYHLQHIGREPDGHNELMRFCPRRQPQPDDSWLDSDSR